MQTHKCGVAVVTLIMSASDSTSVSVKYRELRKRLQSNGNRINSADAV